MSTKRTIGIREAKAQLGRIVRDAKRGREWIITDRGHPVARVVALTTEGLSLEQRVRALEQDGLIQGPGQGRALPPSLPADGWAQRYLQEDRDG